MPQNKTLKDCKDFRELIVRARWESLKPTETRQLKAHLQSCPSCRAFQGQLQSLSRAFKTRPDIEPDPAVKERLLRAFHKKRKQRQNLPVGVRLIKSVLTYRMPVYQFVLVVLIAIVLWQWRTWQQPATKPSTVPVVSSNEMQAAEALPPRIQSHLQIVRRLNGSLSVKDDSTLTQFVVTIM